MHARRWLVLVTVSALLGATGFATACLRPTQIMLQITTDVDCSVVSKQGTTIYGEVSAAPITTTRACSGDAAPRTPYVVGVSRT